MDGFDIHNCNAKRRNDTIILLWKPDVGRRVDS